MSETVLGNINIEDVPSPEIRTRQAVGTIDTATVRDTRNPGYKQVVVELRYMGDSGKPMTYTARWNVRPEWFTVEYAERVRNGSLSGGEKVQYDINFCGLTRGLFKAAGVTGALDFARLSGARVGFRTKVRTDRDSGEKREEIGGFFPPARLAPQAKNNQTATPSDTL